MPFNFQNHIYEKTNFFLAVIVIVFIGFLIPQKFVIPVKGATSGDWNPQSYWAYPWGKSITHKGVDIFAPEGKPVLSSTRGLVVFAGENGRGGNSIMVLGPKWRIHYYAHLSKFHTHVGSIVASGDIIGEVGKTGNAANTPAHLHYSILTLVPYPWRADRDHQGWRKMFYLNPITYLDQYGCVEVAEGD